MGNVFCLVSAMFAPSVGGVERYTYNLGQALLRQGHRVIVVAQNTHAAAAAEMLDGLQIYRMPCTTLMGGRLPLPKPGPEWQALERNLKADRVQHMLVNTRLYPLAPKMLRMAKKLGVPAIVLDHSSNHLSFGGSALLDTIGRWYDHLITFMMKRTRPSFYGVSEASRQWLAHFGIEGRGVLYNAVDLQQIEQEASAAGNALAPYALPARATVVLYAGRLVPEKGILKLVEAVRLATAAGGHFILLAAGEGALYGKLQAALPPWMRLLGNIPHGTLMALMQQSDIYCLPTDYPEGLPTTVLEAAAVGCFCITTAVGGAKELISGPEYGILLEENTPETLRVAIEYAAAHPEARQKAAQAAGQKLRGRFTWGATAAGVLAAFGVEDCNNKTNGDGHG